jgi:DNA polymerase-3 subunit alpha
MLDYTWDLGLGGLAFTDHDCISGAVRAQKSYEAKLEKEWRKIHGKDEKLPDYESISKELDFKAIFGNEIYETEEGLNEANMSSGHFYHLILLAKDFEGFHQIRELSSRSWARGWYRMPIMRTPTYPSDLKDIIKGGHVVCSSACLASFVDRTITNILTGEHPELVNILDNYISEMQNLFGKGNYYLELQPSNREEQISVNKYLIEHYWGKYPFIFTTDAHYLKASLREVHKAFLNSRSSGDRDVDEFYSFAYFMSQDEVRSLMPYVTDEQFSEMVNNSRLIRDMCTYYTLKQKQVIARAEYEHEKEYEQDLQVFDNVEESKYPNFYYYLHTKDETDHYLAELIAHGYVKKYKTSWLDEVYYARLEEELWTIREVGNKIEQHMSDYFITMSKMIDLMWGAGSFVGPSRGSAGVLLINYLLGITQINPIFFNLPYVWRFMHPSRPDLPDIDIDTESDKRGEVFNAIRNYFLGLGGDVVNVCTFGTEGTKSALKTAARGLNVDDDEITYVTSMIPNVRGFDWSLHDCYYGDGEDKKPIAAFKKEMDNNKELWDLAQNIEGLITRLGVHASGVVCLNKDLNDYAAYMKTNRDQLVTSYDLHDLEFCGLVKYDMLTVSALDRMHQAINYMLDDGTIQWQGDLRSTYDKYLSPEVIDYSTPEMWDMADEGKIVSLFQFDTAMGAQAVRQIRPRSLTQLAIANSVMRLMSDKELPIDKYAKFKTCPQLWYDEMSECGLTLQEQSLLEKYLKDSSGVADSQEVIMQLSMDPHIGNFDMKEANRLRKTVAKKNFADIENVRQLFLTKGKAAGASEALLNYVWNYQISLSLGYSFSRIHTTGYSIIAVQEMNLAYHYPIIYWNTACLSVDASAVNSQDFYNLIDDDIINYDDDPNKKTQNKMDYAKIATAIHNFSKVCTIMMPDINKSRLGFTPDVQDNSILYGLKGITRITSPVIDEIMINRPFISLDDFVKRVQKRIVTKDKIVNLIKCGAFDNLEKKPRKQILSEFIDKICDKKNNLTLQNANMLIDYNILPLDECGYSCDVYKLTKELRKNRDPDKYWYLADRVDIPDGKLEAWKQIIVDSGIKGSTIQVDGESRRAIDSAAWDAFYEKNMIKIRSYIKLHKTTLLNSLNTRLYNEEYDKYCEGDENRWELDSLNFYFHKHPLENAISKLGMPVTNLSDLVDGAEDGSFIIKGKVVPKMKLYGIAGTVIDKDKTKGIVTLQTLDGVINVKIYKDLFSIYMATVGEIDENGEKEIEQDSFFEKGTHLYVTGVLRGVVFIPKVYKSTGHPSILKIVLDDQNNFVELEEKKDAS